MSVIQSDFSTQQTLPDTDLLSENHRLRRELARLREREHAADARNRMVLSSLCAVEEGVIVIDDHGTIIAINTVAEQLTGWVDGAVGLAVADVFRVRDDSSNDPLSIPVDPDAGAATRTRQVMLVTRSGERRPVSYRMTSPSTTAGKIIVLHDHATQNRINAELVKSQKHEAVSVLAAGLAHDYNNLLVGVIGSLSLLRRIVANPDAKFNRILESAEVSADKAQRLTQKLVTFASGGDPIRQPLHLPPVIKKIVDRAIFGRRIKSHFFIADDAHLVECDHDQIEQALFNLIENAVDALKNRDGKIEFHIQNVSVGLDSTVNLKPGTYVKITIRDNGDGIPESVHNRIFDPFFTTRKHRVGLGLAIVYSTVRKHGGTITLQSQVGDGSTFSIYVPACNDAATSDCVVPDNPAGIRGTILLMDDQEIVRDVAAEMLKELGFAVTITCDGQEALDAFDRAQQSGRPFDAVILDLQIPGGMGGLETIRQLKARDPRVKAIVASGYSDTSAMANYEAHGFRDVIYKPFKLATFEAAINRTLGAAQDSRA